MDEELERQRRRDRWDALEALEVRVEQVPLAFARVHAQLLRDALELASAYSREGQSLSVAPQVALLLRCSSSKAERLLNEAAVLAGLPDGFAALDDGLLTLEQSAVTTLELSRVPDLPTRLTVWRRLLERLRADLASGATLPPPRLRELLRRWVLEVAPKDAEELREEAAAQRRVEYRRRDDGLADLMLFGIGASLAQAVLSRIRENAEPVSPYDDRTADQRRLDAAVDLLLGRVGQHSSCTAPTRRGGAAPTSGSGAGPEAGVPAAAQAGPAAAGAVCGCLPGTPVPCGAELLVLVPIGAALGTTTEVCEVSGYGPVEPDVLQQLLLAAPVLRAVHVDADGVPVSVSERVHRPQRRDPQSVRQALLDLAAEPPGIPQPRHPHDHRPGQSPAHDHAGTRPAQATGAAAGAGAAHPPDAPGPYRPPRRLRRLVKTRAPRCEFPGCGMPAVRCDDEHDVAWPDGPTCACQLGPCCRRHHRVKQEGWVKLRLTGSAVRWTTPTGRQWLSRPQHPAPAPPLRPPPAVRQPSEWDELDPASLEHELWLLTERPDDPAGLELRATDPHSDDAHGPDAPDRLGELITSGATRWTLDLDDPYSWTAVPLTAD